MNRELLASTADENCDELVSESPMPGQFQSNNLFQELADLLGK